MPERGRKKQVHFKSVEREGRDYKRNICFNIHLSLKRQRHTATSTQELSRKVNFIQTVSETVATAAAGGARLVE